MSWATELDFDVGLLGSPVLIVRWWRRARSRAVALLVLEVIVVTWLASTSLIEFAENNRFRFELVVAPEAERAALFFKKMANDIIFESPQLQQIEHKARKVLFDLWESCWRYYVEPPPRVIRILPPRVGQLIDAESTQAGKARRICDWLSGLTDGMIVRTYRRLFDPEFGSIRDLS